MSEDPDMSTEPVKGGRAVRAGTGELIQGIAVTVVTSGVAGGAVKMVTSTIREAIVQRGQTERTQIDADRDVRIAEIAADRDTEIAEIHRARPVDGVGSAGPAGG